MSLFALEAIFRSIGVDRQDNMGVTLNIFWISEELLIGTAISASISVN